MEFITRTISQDKSIQTMDPSFIAQVSQFEGKNFCYDNESSFNSRLNNQSLLKMHLFVKETQSPSYR